MGLVPLNERNAPAKAHTEIEPLVFLLAAAGLDLGMPELAAFTQPTVLGLEHPLVLVYLSRAFGPHMATLRLEFTQYVLLHPAEVVISVKPASCVRDVT